MAGKQIMLGRASTSRQEMSKDLQLDAIEAKFGKMDEVFFDEMSKELQLDAIEAKFGKMDGVFFDTASGDAKLDKREAVIECIATLSKGDTIYIYSWSRLARDVFIHLWIEEEVKKRKECLVKLCCVCSISLTKECIATLSTGDTIYIYSWSRLARDVCPLEAPLVCA